MASELLKHNQDAYTAALQMLQTTGKDDLLAFSLAIF